MDIWNSYYKIASTVNYKFFFEKRENIRKEIEAIEKIQMKIIKLKNKVREMLKLTGWEK